MEQLRMIRFSGVIKKRELPKGYTYDSFHGTNDEINDWLEISSNGLIPDTEIHWFYEAIRDYPHIDIYNDLFFVKDELGKRVATSCSIAKENNEGYIHMVASLPSCRGLGIGHAMLCKSLIDLEKRNCKYITLTTDDFRLPAIKTYLDAGFLPSLNKDDSEMMARWDNVIKDLGIEDVKYHYE